MTFGRRLALVALGVVIVIGASESLRLRPKAPAGPQDRQEMKLKIDELKAWAEAHRKRAKPTNLTPSRLIAR